MFIDIHRHNSIQNDNIFVLRNIFPEQVTEYNISSYYSIGLHPWYVGETDLKMQLSVVDKYASLKNILAIGETGLDKKVNIPYIKQIEAFERQIEIARLRNKPVIIHCVKAYDDIITIRKKSDISIPWIIHWFNNNMQIANQLIEKNCYLSFGCSLFNETGKAFKVFPDLPLERIFLETDDTQYFIEEVYVKAAYLKNINVEVLKKQIKNNFKTCFDILL